ncbi:MAG: hypothetical protein ACLRPW_08340 [Intestinibacter sp.]
MFLDIEFILKYSNTRLIIFERIKKFRVSRRLIEIINIINRWFHSKIPIEPFDLEDFMKK